MMKWFTASSPLALLCALAACGGGGGSDGSGSTPPPAAGVPSPTPAPAPTPTPTPAPVGEVALYSEGLNPDGASSTLMEIKATNAGIYILAEPSDDTRPWKVFKVQGSPAQSQSWISATPDNDADSMIVSFAPSNIYSETDRGVGFYWASIGAGRPKFNKWGWYSANAGGVSITADDDSIGAAFGNTIEMVVSGAVNGIVAPRPWIIAELRGGSDGYRVFQDDGAYTAANTISDRFSTPALPNLGARTYTQATGQPSVAISHPRDPNLYVGAGNTLYVYDAQQRLRTFTFPTNDPSAGFSDLIWSDNDLYIAFGNNIYRLRDNTVTLFMPIPLGLGGPPGRFCITGGWLYTIDGTARSLGTGTTRNWISRGTLNSAQTQAAGSLQGGLGMGVYCMPNNGNTIWTFYPTLSGQRGIRRITPLG
ncbi:hypothetical protein [Qipengyuania sediminis]|uniref:hypothetical protein n=1 Tax=Qipengyuania sediminis TaxID=1532023 RepID=UPI00105A1158|nr:hypothetical protein [Qipengyuania sediminis]